MKWTSLLQPRQAGRMRGLRPLASELQHRPSTPLPSAACRSLSGIKSLPSKAVGVEYSVPIMYSSETTTLGNLRLGRREALGTKDLYSMALHKAMERLRQHWRDCGHLDVARNRCSKTSPQRHIPYNTVSSAFVTAPKLPKYAFEQLLPGAGIGEVSHVRSCCPRQCPARRMPLP